MALVPYGVRKAHPDGPFQPAALALKPLSGLSIEITQISTRGASEQLFQLREELKTPDLSKREFPFSD